MREGGFRVDLAKVYERCVSELERFISDAGFHDAVIGLSGGIDSSLVATMAVDALGSSRVHGVLLHSSWPVRLESRPRRYLSSSRIMLLPLPTRRAQVAIWLVLPPRIHRRVFA